MDAVEIRFPKDFDKSFVVFQETGTYFPCPWHFHPEYELVLITKSTGRRMVGDHIGYFEEDDLVFMGSMLPHVWVNDPLYTDGRADHLADAIVVHFVEEFLGEDFLSIPEMQDFRKVLRLAERGMVFKDKVRREINGLLKTMPTKNGMQRLSTLFSIFDLMARTTEYDLLASPTFVQNFQYDTSDRFRRITEYILNNFDRDISLTEIASVANMGITSFCNFFKEQFRATFVEYLNTVRIGHACKLLGDNDLNVAEIAFECGFNNLANFNRQFKKLKNMTPTCYRRTLLVP